MKDDIRKQLVRYINKTKVRREPAEKIEAYESKISKSGFINHRKEQNIPAINDMEISRENKKQKLAALKEMLEQISSKSKKINCKATCEIAHREVFKETPGIIPGSYVQTNFGEIWINETRKDIRTRFGGIYLCDCLSLNGEMASILGMDEVLSSFDPAKAVYLDTESSGLELSTATIPFLIGIGFIEGENIVVRQLFMDRIDREPIVLQYLNELLEGRNQIVTFNGKSYDIPLLKTRYIFNRLNTTIDEMVNFDLLHVVRRIYRRRIKECSLVSCERQILGFLREGDIPGDMIPSFYASFIRENRMEMIPAIFHHNLQDIITMFALVGALGRLLSWKDDSAQLHPDDLLSLARVGIKRGRHQEAEEIWDYSTENFSGDKKVESLLGLAKLARKRQDYMGAAKLLEIALDEMPDSCHIHLMLSKIYEHDIENYSSALRHALMAQGAEEEERWHKRVERIKLKINKNKSK